MLSVCGDGTAYTLFLETDPSKDDSKSRQYSARFSTRLGYSRVRSSKCTYGWGLFGYFLLFSETTNIVEVEISISADVSEEARIDPRKFWSYLHPQLHFNWSSSDR